MFRVRARHQSLFLKSPVDNSVCPSLGVNWFKDELGDLNSRHQSFVCMYTSVCKLKISTLKQTFKQNHLWLVPNINKVISPHRFF